MKSITLRRETERKYIAANTYLHEEKSMKKKRYNIKSDPIHDLAHEAQVQQPQTF
jgi:hypothetical protein